MMKCIFAIMLERGQRGTTTLKMPGYRKKRKLRVFQKEGQRRSGQDGKQRQIKPEFQKKVMQGGEDKIDEDLATVQETVETAAGNVAHHTQAEREKHTEDAGDCQIP